MAGRFSFVMAGLDPAIRRDTKIGANRGAFAAVASDRRVNPRIKSGGGDDDDGAMTMTGERNAIPPPLLSRPFHSGRIQVIQNLRDP
jgi:hypothetical protein